jgi:hypothetical protein
MKNRLLIPVALLAALGALAVAGCGGDDETTDTTAVAGASGVGGIALTQEEWAEQADTICATADKEIDAVGEELFGGQQPSQDQIDEFVTDALVPSVQGQLDAIQALTPPEEIADDVTAFLDDANAALDEIRDDPSLAASEGGDSPFADVNQQAKDLGLEECGSDS